MPDDIKPAEPAATPATTPAPPKGRKYTYLGKAYPNPKVSITIGQIKIKPWSMTDEQIDKLLDKQPELKRLWKVNT